MGKLITITTLNGSEPYQVYICTSAITFCNYYSTINDIDIPYNITVPFPINNYTSYGIKIIDANGCIITQTITI